MDVFFKWVVYGNQKPINSLQTPKEMEQPLKGKVRPIFRLDLFLCVLFICMFFFNFCIIIVVWCLCFTRMGSHRSQATRFYSSHEVSLSDSKANTRIIWSGLRFYCGKRVLVILAEHQRTPIENFLVAIIVGFRFPETDHLKKTTSKD